MKIDSFNIANSTGGTSDVSVTSSSNGKISAVTSNLRVEGSHNFTLAGADHRLVALTNCSNIKVDGTSCNLNFNKTFNTNVTGGLCITENVKAYFPAVQVTSSSNGTISAVNSAIEILKCTNFKVFGESHENILLKSCSNVLVGGTQGTIHLDSAINTKIQGDRNTVKATDVSNFSVQGDGNNVHVKNVTNHKVQPSTVRDTNIYEVSPQCGDKSIWARFASYALGVNNHERFNVDYVDKAKISGAQYDLGTFRFNTKQHESYIDVRVETTPENPLNVKLSEQGNSVELGRQNGTGVPQKLVLKGSRVVQTDNDDFRIIN